MLLKELELIAPDSLLAAQLRLRFAWSDLGRAFMDAYPWLFNSIDDVLAKLSSHLRNHSGELYL